MSLRPALVDEGVFMWNKLDGSRTLYPNRQSNLFNGRLVYFFALLGKRQFCCNHGEGMRTILTLVPACKGAESAGTSINASQ